LICFILYISFYSIEFIVFVQKLNVIYYIKLTLTQFESVTCKNLGLSCVKIGDIVYL